MCESSRDFDEKKIFYSLKYISFLIFYCLMSFCFKKKRAKKKQNTKCKDRMVRRERGRECWMRTSRSIRGCRERKEERKRVGEVKGIREGDKSAFTVREGWRKEIECRLVSSANSVPNRYPRNKLLCFPPLSLSLSIFHLITLN